MSRKTRWDVEVLSPTGGIGTFILTNIRLKSIFEHRRVQSTVQRNPHPPSQMKQRLNHIDLMSRSSRDEVFDPTGKK